MNLADLKTEVNFASKRFEISIGSQKAFVDFLKNTQGQIFLTHTEVPKEFEGKGIASKLAKDALEWIDKNNLKLFPLCPYIVAYIKRNPEYKRLLAAGANV